MINQASNNNSSKTDLATTEAINMPSEFTSKEANHFKQQLQQLDLNLKPVANNSLHPIAKKIIFNFEKTIFIDKGGLAGLCQILKLARENKIDLTFSRFSPEVKIILSLIGLEQAFPIAE